MAATVTVRWMVADRMSTGSLGDLTRARSSGGVVWVDILEPDEDVLSVIGRAFELHELAIEDALHFPQRPKIDAYPSNLFIVWVAPRLGDGCSLATSEIDIFLGTDYLVTSHRDRVAAIDSLAQCVGDELAHGAEWILHGVLDRSVDDMFPVVDLVGEELDRIEDELLVGSHNGHLQQLAAVKRTMLELHRVIGPERDVLRSMARHEELVSQEAYLYLQDVGDHVARVSDAIDTYRDVASSVMDIYLSTVSNQLNVVMKQLTVVATIFMPLTLISGVYGMNITAGMWPSTEWFWSFPLVIGSFVVIAAGMLYVFKKRGWW